MAPRPEEVDAGAPFTIRLVVETGSGCDLSGTPWRVLDAEGHEVGAGVLGGLVAITSDHPDYDPRHGAVDMRPAADVSITAPEAIGTHLLRIALAPCEVEGIAHEGAEVALELRTRTHRTSLAVWDCPSPMGAGAPLRLAAGARCSAGCRLTGRMVELIDEAGTVQASAMLGEEPRPGTTGLYWCMLEAAAPQALGRNRWSVRLVPEDTHPIPHESAHTAGFAFTVVAAPEHRVRVRVTDSATGDPIAGAQIRIGVFRGATDAGGRVAFHMPGGEHALSIWKENLEAPGRVLAVSSDLDIEIAGEVLPEKDPYAFYYEDQN